MIKESKNYRTLDMYVRLCEGKTIHKPNEAVRFGVDERSIKRVVEPVVILFSEYYFYLNAYIVEKDETGKYVHKYGYPAVFRIDRKTF